ncbi:uncharacterized protein LOC141801500 [Halichoeres trimaculatus]|uniref:uncharacterized protein LOC141801500 n=1 Tax=Halichoeres trimaculatus TaxID=147232 RepID=UPI003D9F31E4
MSKISVCACLLSALTFVEMNPINRNAPEGTTITIICSDWKASTYVKDNVKYFCRSPCSKDKHIIVKADYQKTERKNRIEITNSEHGLFVTISNLQESDSGKYYCGVDRFGYDVLLEVNVKVTDAEPSPPKTTPKTTPKTVHVAVTTSPSTSSKGSTVSTNASSTNESLSTSTTNAMQSQKGSVSYLIIILVVVTSVMLLLIIVWKKIKKQEKAISRVDVSQEDVVEDVHYEEIRQEDQQPESLSTLEHSADPDSLYSNASFLQRYELAAQGDNDYYSNYPSLNPAPSSRGCSRGTSSKSMETGLQSDLVYSLAQLPNQKTNPAGQSEPSKSEGHKKEMIYAVVEKPQKT